MAGKGLSQARKMRKLKAPRKETMSLIKTHSSNQEVVIGQIKQFGGKRDLAEFAPEIKAYKVSSKVKMTPERAMRHYSGEKGLNPTKMTQEVLGDVYKQTYDTIRAVDRKKAKRFTKAWNKRQVGGGEEMTLEGFIHARAARRFGFSKAAEAVFTDAIIKYASGKYEDKTYKSHVRSVTRKERVMRGAMSSGAPSALLTGALGLASGMPTGAAMKAAVGVGMLGTTIGAMSASAKQRVFVPTNG